jgi:hypothetical protein
MNRSARPLVLLTMGLLTGAIGCGNDGPRLVDARGTVTLDGNPVPNATLTFVPKDGTGSPSYGTTDGNGNYTLRYSRDKTGVLPGTHDVTITTDRVSPDDVPPGETPPLFIPLPRKYSEKGTLTAEVTENRNVIDFELTSD